MTPSALVAQCAAASAGPGSPAGDFARRRCGAPRGPRTRATCRPWRPPLPQLRTKGTVVAALRAGEEGGVSGGARGGSSTGVRDGRGRGPGRADPRLEARTADPAGRARGEPGNGDRAFLVYEDERTTFAEHFRQAATWPTSCATASACEGRPRRHRHAQLPRVVVAFWAAAAAGAVVVPLNAWWTGPELEYGLQDSGSGCCSPTPSAPSGSPTISRSSALRRRGRGQGRGRWRPDGEARSTRCSATSTRRRAARRDLDPEDDATIFYTSGTTGRPEGRARHPPQHLHQPDEPRVRPGPAAARARRADLAAMPRRHQRPERLPAVGAVLPRHRVPLDPRGQPRPSAGRS